MGKVRIEHQKEDNIVYSAIAAVSVVALIQLVGQNNLSIALKISLYSFAISIPSSAASIFFHIIEKYYKYTDDTPYMNIMRFIGVFFGGVGIGSIFFHFHWTFGAVFCLTT